MRASFAASAEFQRKRVEHDVNEALDNARTNGWDFREKPALEVAEDMTQYCAALEMERPEALVPFIEEWQKAQNGSNT